MKRKKNKPSKLGLDWVNIGIYILMPILILLMIIVLFFTIKNEINKYLDEKKIEESIYKSESILQESIKESELYERYLEESSIEKEKERKEKIVQEEAVQRKNQIEFENEIFSKYWPHGTYVRNNKTKEYGVVSYCQIPNVYTEEGWYFEAYPNENGEEGFFNKDITQVGWIEWYNNTQKLYKNKSVKYQEKINKIINEELQKRERDAKIKFPPNPKYSHAKYFDKYYYVFNWKNGVLSLKERNTKDIIHIQYDDPNISKIDPTEIKKFLVKE